MDQAEKLRKIIDGIKLKNETPIEAPKIANARRTARVITVTSGKGGVGKTNITVNIAIALSNMGYRVVILDADFGLANIDVLFGLIPQYTLVDVIKNSKNILEVLATGPNNIKFLSGGSGVEDLVKISEEEMKLFLGNMSLLDRLADVILIDTGAGISENVMSFIMAADETVLITTPEPTAITDAYALMKMVSKRDKEKKLKVIVNRVENSNEAYNIINKLTTVSQKFLDLDIINLGYIQNDESVIKAVKMQQPFTLSYPKGIATKQLKSIVNKLVIEEDKNKFDENGLRGFIGRLINHISM
jgi:flagellar biosynthesis protein FlhG